MTDKKMPIELFVWDCPRSIGDLGFTKDTKDDGFASYTRTEYVHVALSEVYEMVATGKDEEALVKLNKLRGE